MNEFDVKLRYKTTEPITEEEVSELFKSAAEIGRLRSGGKTDVEVLEVVQVRDNA